MDEQLRNLERGQGPQNVAKYLRAKMRAGDLSELQLQLAACLRYPPAVILYPNNVCGVGDGERPTLTSEGMVVHCAGAMQLGTGIFEFLQELDPPEIYSFYVIIFRELLAPFIEDPRVQETLQLINRSHNLLNSFGDYLPRSSIYLVNDNNSSCDNCGKITEEAEINAEGGWSTVLCEECSPILLSQTFLNTIITYYTTRWGSTATHYAELGGPTLELLLVAILYLTQRFFEYYAFIDVKLEELFDNLNINSVFLTACRFNPDIIDTHQMAVAILNS